MGMILCCKDKEESETVVRKNISTTPRKRFNWKTGMYSFISQSDNFTILNEIKGINREFSEYFLVKAKVRLNTILLQSDSCCKLKVYSTIKEKKVLLSELSDYLFDADIITFNENIPLILSEANLFNFDVFLDLVLSLSEREFNFRTSFFNLLAERQTKLILQNPCENENQPSLELVLNRDEENSSQLTYVCLAFNIDLQTSDQGDYFYVLSKYKNGIDWTNIYKSEEQTGKLINFNTALLSINSINLEESNLLYLIEIYEYYDGIQGHALFSMHDLKSINYSINIVSGSVDMESRVKSPIKLIKSMSKNVKSDQETKLKKINKKVIGNANMNFYQQYYMNLMDYIYKGLKLRISFAFDFTIANGVQTEKTSKHYLSDDLNLYEKVCKCVLTNFEQAGLIEEITAYGFGCNPNQGKLTEFSFPLNIKKETSQMQNMNDLLKNYKDTVRRAKFSGPANTQHILKLLINRNNTSNEQLYDIIVFLVVGDVSDHLELLDCLVETSKRSLSFMVVGIGNGPFDQLNDLNLNEENTTNSNTTRSIQGRRDLSFTRNNIKFHNFKESETEENFTRTFANWSSNQVEEYLLKKSNNILI